MANVDNETSRVREEIEVAKLTTPNAISKIITDIQDSGNKELKDNLETIFKNPAQAKVMLNKMLAKSYDGMRGSKIAGAVSSLAKEIGPEKVNLLTSSLLKMKYQNSTEQTKKEIAKLKEKKNGSSLDIGLSKQMDALLKTDTPTRKVGQSKPAPNKPLSRSASTSDVKPQRARRRSGMGM